MDYFEHFGITRSFQPPMAVVKKVFLDKSRALHPDLNTHQLQTEKLEELTAFNNEAYQTLSKEHSLFSYLLNLHGIFLGDLSLSPGFLGEMMELNEIIADIRLENNPQKIEAMARELEELKEKWRLDLQPVLDDYDKGNLDASLSVIAEYCLKSNYLRRLTHNLSGQLEL